MDDCKYDFISLPYRIDRKLYKYYSRAEYAIDSIKNRRIHLDNPRTFNDPFEAAFRCNFYSDLPTIESQSKVWSKVHVYIATVAKKHPCHMYNEMIAAMMAFMIKNDVELWKENYPICLTVRKIYDLLNSSDFSFEDFCNAINLGFAETDGLLYVSCKMSCFSEVKDSILMWSYYANCHKGICVEYDLSKLDSSILLNQQIVENISKVHYSPIRADVLPSSEASELNFLTSKAEVWSHEHEWRIICETKEEYLPFDCVSAVYIGSNFDTNTSKYQKLITAVNTYSSLNIYKCKLNNEKYQIDFEEKYNSNIAYEMRDYRTNRKENGVSKSIINIA